MVGPGVEVRRAFWQLVRSGLSPARASEALGRSRSLGSRLMREAGGVNLVPIADPVGRYLSLAEREEILRLREQGEGVRVIAARLGRSASTISRELGRGASKRGYRPSVGQREADQARRGPRRAKLARNLPLRRQVQQMLTTRLSPEQIAGRLKIDFPDDREMWVSAETIYQSLYIQARGGLKRELTTFLRTGRAMRKPRRSSTERRGRIPGMVMISDRPAEVADRAVPGHWEGDLIEGSKASNSAVGTLVERSSGFVLLLHLPDGHSPAHLQAAITTAMASLPEQLWRSLTWDQGKEMSGHAQITQDTGLDIYFCDPHSPWQRGSNENTNGLLRQYMPKGTDLSFYGAGILANIAAELNARPRKRHGFRTPAEVLQELLSKANTEHGVA